MNKKNHSKSLDRNLCDNRTKNNSLAEKNGICLINNYLEGNKEKEKQNNNLNNNKNKVNNDKKSINVNNRSRAKLIKSFNSLFSSRKKLKKNASENKIINSKFKK